MIRVGTNRRHEPKPGFTYPVIEAVREFDAGLGLGVVLLLGDGSVTMVRLSAAELAGEAV